MDPSSGRFTVLDQFAEYKESKSSILHCKKMDFCAQYVIKIYVKVFICFRNKSSLLKQMTGNS